MNENDLIREAEALYPKHSSTTDVNYANVYRQEGYLAAARKYNQREIAEKIVADLATWSKKYPRGRIYPMSGQEGMDGQLIELEERAKEYLSSLPKPQE